jgi:hypothetical protein
VCSKCGMEGTAYSPYDAQRLLAGHDCVEHLKRREVKRRKDIVQILSQRLRAKREMQV